MRIDPPVRISTPIVFTEDITTEGVLIKKGQPIMIHMYNMHYNPEEWIEPQKYIPERFDPTNKLSVRPDGGKRHMMSYGPFLGGKRVCLGKTFAENIGKCVLPIIYSQLDFEIIE